MLVFSLAAIAFSLVSVPALAQSCTRTYTVKPGDICDSISAFNNASSYQLATVNQAINSNCSNLYPGQNLCLGTSGADCTHTYVVKSNDDCDNVAANNNINSTILHANNPQLNAGCTNMYIGEVLCVAGTVTVPSSPYGSSVPAGTIPSTALPSQPTGYYEGDGDDNDWCE